MTPEEHVAKLFKSRASDDANSTTLANTLNKDIETVFNTVDKFIFELLQNADDAARPDTPVSVSFKIIGQRLVVSHNGRPFDQDDVNAICDNAQRSHTKKRKDIEKTGYKGIGFKSVFVIADRVHIVSGSNYSFRFDKQLPQWEEHDEDKPDGQYPWQIIPIWTDRPDLTPDTDRVYFVLDLKPHIDLTNAFETVLESPQIFLFMRHTHQIQFSGPNTESSITIESDKNRRKLIVDGSVKSEWVIHANTVEVPTAVRERIALMGAHECPQKLKEATAVSITFAAKLNDGHIAALEDARLYTYLPTTVTCGLQFLANSDFLLTADRMAFLDNVWNQFLFAAMARLQLDWLAELALQPENRDHILRLYTPKISHVPEGLITAYNEAFVEAQETKAFLPAFSDEKRLLKYSEAKSDKVSFYKTFPEKLKNTQYVVRYELQKIDRLRLSTVELSHLIKYLKKLPRNFHDLLTQEKLLRYLMQTMPEDIRVGREYVSASLAEAAFLLDENTHLEQLNMLTLPTEDHDEIPDWITLPKKRIHPALLAIDGAEAWLSKMSMGRLTLDTLINCTVDYVTSDLATQKNALRFLMKIMPANQKAEYHAPLYRARQSLKGLTLFSSAQGEQLKTNALHLPRTDKINLPTWVAIPPVINPEILAIPGAMEWLASIDIQAVKLQTVLKNFIANIETFVGAKKNASLSEQQNIVAFLVKIMPKLHEHLNGWEISALKEKRYMLGQDGQLHSPKTLHLATDDYNAVSDWIEMRLPLVHADLASITGAKAWMHEVGIRDIDNKHLIETILNNLAHYCTAHPGIAFQERLLTFLIKGFKDFPELANVTRLRQMAAIPFLMANDGSLKQPAALHISTDAYRDVAAWISLQLPLVHDELMQVEGAETWLQEIGVKPVSAEVLVKDVVNNIKHYCQTTPTPAFQIQLLDFLMQQFALDEDLAKPSIINQLKSSDFLLRDDETFGSPTDVYIPTEKYSELSNYQALSIPLAHPSLLEDKDRTAWLSTLGVAPVPLPVLLREMAKLKKNSDWEISDAVGVVKFLLKLFLRKEITDSQVSTFSWLPLLTRDNDLQEKYGDCYLPSRLKPAFDLEAAVPEASEILSETYLTEINTEDERSRAKTFFTFLGVNEDLMLENYSHTRRNAYLGPEYYTEYIQHLAKTQRIKHLTIKNDNTVYPNAVYVSFMQYLYKPAYATAFWTLISDEWNSVKKVVRAGYSSNRNCQTQTVPSYLAYYLGNHKCLLGSDGELHSASEILSPVIVKTFKKLNLGPVIVSNSTEELTAEMSTFFGFKSTLSIENYNALFSSLENPTLTLQRNHYLSMLYQRLIEEDFTDTEIAGFTGKLLAANGTLQPISGLQLCTDEFLLGRLPKSALMACPKNVTAEELEELATLLNIPERTSHEINEDITDQCEDPELKERIIHAGLITLLFEHKDDLPTSAKVYLQWLPKLTQLSYHSAENIQVQIADGPFNMQHALLHDDRLIVIRKRSAACMRQLVTELTRYLGLTSAYAATFKEILALAGEELEERLEEEGYTKDHAQQFVSKLLALKCDKEDPEKIEGLAELEQDTIEQPTIVRSTSFTDEEEAEETDAIVEQSTIVRSTLFTVKGFGAAITRLPTIQVEEEETSLDTVEYTQIVPVTYRHSSNTTSTPSTAKINTVPATNFQALAPAEMQPLLSTIPRLPFFAQASIAGSVQFFEDDARKATGRWGEKFVFNFLQRHYQQKYTQCIYQETDNGFTLTGTHKNQALNLEVNWPNKTTESYRPYDFSITKNGRTRYIDVKSTYKAGECTAFVSRNEWELIRESGPRYRLFCVFNANTTHPQLLKIKDPAAALMQGRIEPQQLQLRVHL